MAKADKHRIYQHMEKVIVTLDDLARIGYVVATKDGNTGFFFEGRSNVRIAYHLEDAQERRYKIINGAYVLPYREELWQAFQQLEFKRMEIVNMFAELRTGKIPQELLQPGLFGKENTRPIGRE